MDLVTELRKQLKEELEILLDLEDKIEELEASRTHQSKVVNRLNRALGAITGELGEEDSRTEEGVGQAQGAMALGGLQEAPREVPSPPPSPRELPSPYPLCPACGSRMVPGTRTLKSGKTINLMICSDSGCNNEII